VLSVVISLIMSSAFASILIYAIDLVPHRVGLVGGLFYGLAFGLGGLAAAALGVLARPIGIIACSSFAPGCRLWVAHFSAPRASSGSSAAGPRLEPPPSATRVGIAMRTLWPWLSASETIGQGALAKRRNFRDTSTALVPDRCEADYPSSAMQRFELGLGRFIRVELIVPHGRRPLAVDDFQSHFEFSRR